MPGTLLEVLLDRAHGVRIVPPQGPRGFQPALAAEDSDEEILWSEDDGGQDDRNEHLIGEFLVIRYVDSNGEESQRRIALHCAYERNGRHYVRAYCYERAAPRLFRKDRILEIIDAESGEIIDDLNQIAEAVVDMSEPLDSREATKTAFQLQKHGILILLFLARCDGQFHSAEEDVLLGYLDHGCGDKGVDEDYALRRLKRLSPDPISYEESVQCMAQFRKEELERVARFARQLIDADGAISPEEAQFGMALQAYRTESAQKDPDVRLTQDR